MASFVHHGSQIVNGSRLRVWRRDLGFWHVGIAIWQDGSSLVIHNQKGRGVIWSFLADFAHGEKVVVVDVPNAQHGAERVNRAIHFLGRAYDLVLFNCEHFVSLVCDGAATSPQLKGAMGLVAVGGLVLWALANAA